VQQAQNIKAQYLWELQARQSSAQNRAARLHLQRLCHRPQRTQQLSVPSLCVTGDT
jgi:hypothetical protein